MIRVLPDTLNNSPPKAVIVSNIDENSGKFPAKQAVTGDATTSIDDDLDLLYCNWDWGKFFLQNPKC